MNDIEPQATLEGPSDQELRSLGLEPVRSWVRRAPTRKSARNRRHREKARANGRRQVSAMVPEACRPLVRELCQQLCNERITRAELEAIVLKGRISVDAAPSKRRPGGRAAGLVPNAWGPIGWLLVGFGLGASLAFIL